MEENRTIDRLKYEAVTHHKQNLRKQINPHLIQRLEVSEHPSENYKKAYQSIYHDEVEKTLQQQNIKKLKKRIQEEYTKRMHTDHIPTNGNYDYSDLSGSQYDKVNNTTQNSPNHYLQVNKNSQEYYKQIVNSQQGISKGFKDYVQDKDKRVKQLIDKNFDGGQSFYRSHDAFLRNKILQSSSLQNILKDQIEWKNYSKNIQRQKVDQQNQSYQRFTSHQKDIDLMKKYAQEYSMQDLRGTILKQMEEERIRKLQNNTFRYQNIAKHNPITNPIQYHIENPYILKRIQDKSSFKNIR